MTLFLLCLFAYLAGSIPFGVIVGKILGIDLRIQGSGNIGAANAFRTLGVVPAVCVLLGDMLKGVLALVVAKHVLPPQSPPIQFVLVGLCSIFGHNYSCFLRFRGGKGVATTLGVFLFISWKATFVVLASWLLVVWLTHFASLASLTAAFLLPVFLVVFGEPWLYAAFAFVSFAITVYTHRSNIRRLLSHQENKIFLNKAPTGSGDQ